MTKPFKETPDQIVIDKKEVESLTKRFLAAVKAFAKTVIGEASWERLGLEKTWRFFLPLAAILFFFLVQKVAFLSAILTLIITAVWLWRSRRK